MIDKLANIFAFITVWLGLFALPVVAVWTIGAPVYGFTFWFSASNLMVVIAWFWVTFLFVLSAVLRKE